MEERYKMSIPFECPKCGTVLDVPDMQGDRVVLQCPNPRCDWEKDVTSEDRLATELNGED